MAENKSASFEASLARLQEIVTQLEGDHVELEQSVALYREGRELVDRCEAMLRTAEETLRQAAPAAAAGGNTRAPAAEAGDDEVAF